MRFALILLALVSAAARTTLASTDAMGVEFFKFMVQFGKNYSSETELAQRFNIFKDNYRTVMTHNMQDKPYKLGINQFSDMTLEEFSRKMNTYGRSSTPTMELITEIAPIPSSYNLPSSVNWINKGAVTPIKNQGQCGSCWSFSTTGALEGAYFLKHGNLLSFSEQQLVSCSTNDGGCGGGFVGPAYDFIKSNGGICSEADYPYTSGSTQQSGTCVRNCQPVADVSGYYRVSPNNEVALANAVALQPVSTLICATSAVFQNYKSGVINDASCGTCQDHAVLIVGYGTDAATGLDYWLIKNSWDTWWGDNGYVRVLKTSSTSSIGTCAVSGRSVYPYAV